MRYLRIIWQDSSPALPVSVYAEVDAADWERRKVEMFRNGRIAWADATGANKKTGTTLSESRIPSLDEINGIAGVEACAISREEFEAVWAKAHDSPSSQPLANPKRRRSHGAAREPTNLERVLVNEVLSLHRWIGLLPEEEMDPDTAVKMAETTGHALDSLTTKDRDTFVRAAETLSAKEGWEAGDLEDLLAAFGLADPPSEREGPGE